MTYDPPFCKHCDHFLRDDWWHDADCPLNEAGQVCTAPEADGGRG